LIKTPKIREWQVHSLIAAFSASVEQLSLDNGSVFLRATRHKKQKIDVIFTHQCTWVSRQNWWVFFVQIYPGQNRQSHELCYTAVNVYSDIFH
jgi:hypothetical protein